MECGRSVAWLRQLLGKVGRVVHACADARNAFAASMRPRLRRLFGDAGPSSIRVETDDLEEPALHAHKMESLGRLTGGVAHDFNNLLTVVLGNATALRVSAEARGDTQGIRRAEMIERAAERGGRLAGQLLAFSRKQMLRPKIVSVYRVISATHALLAQAAGESARVLLQAEPDLWNSLVDPGQLESAILNLVLNARDAMPAGGTIDIFCRNARVRHPPVEKSLSAVSDYVRIDVSDSGTGISPEIQEKVFEPFFTTKPVGQGSGLGLAQVHGFVGQSGGWAELKSIVGRGTTISIFLPRAKDPVSEALPAADGPAADGSVADGSVADGSVADGPVADGTVPNGNDGPGGNNQTVLVVEPDVDLRITTCETLVRSGYNAVGVANGSGALTQLISEEPIHALLTAARLPGGVSGAALARSARQVRPDLCVLLTSGTLDDIPGEADHASLGGDKRFEFVMKPYRAPDLVRMVGAVLSSNTFSTETEQLLADVRDTVPATAPPGALSDVRRSSSADTTPQQERRNNAIRLGVMPFRSIVPNSDAAFSQGLAEEITTAFSRFRWITCVGPASVAALANEPLAETERWKELDLDYLIEGSFRKKGNKIGVLLRLKNMRGAGAISWGRRFDGLLPDLLDLQDRIASETAAQVAPELLVWEGLEAKSRPRVDPTAYDMMLRAIPAIYRLDELAFRESGRLLERSLALDPSSAACHSWFAHWHLFLLGQGWAADVEGAIQRADELAKRAIALDSDDARGFTVAGHVRAFLNKDAEGALELHERAIALNPNMALAWCYSGLAHSYLGEHTEAIRRIQHAKRLSPHDPHGFFFDMALVMPFLLTGQFEAAAQVGRVARDHHPGLSSTYKGLLSALGHLGANREAAAVRKGLLALENHFSIRVAASRSPLTRRDDLDLYLQGLRLAGVPERSKPALASH
jgi:signal transduction histidine kinase/TolB-like protein/CheY-like chemotaxis protein